MIKIAKILVLLFGLWMLYKLIKKRQNKELKKNSSNVTVVLM